MKELRLWWGGLSGRERRLLSVMLVLVSVVFLWLGVWRPVRWGLDEGWARYGSALDRNASVKAKLALLKALPPATASGVSIEQAVSQSAVEAGLTLDRSGSQGEGRMTVAVASARSGALLAWLSGLESRGINVETLNITPGGTPGTVAAQAVLRSAR